MVTPVEAATPDDVLVEFEFATAGVPAAVPADEAPLLDDPSVTGELTAVPAVTPVEDALLDDAGVAGELAAMPALEVALLEDAGVATEEDPAFALVRVAVAVPGHTVCEC